MALDDQIHENDKVFTSHDVKVIVDDRTLLYLKGGTISYLEANGRSGFQIQPQSQSGFSGCGDGCSC